MSRPSHTRISAVERRAQIITATRKVALAAGCTTYVSLTSPPSST